MGLLIIKHYPLIVRGYICGLDSMSFTFIDYRIGSISFAIHSQQISMESAKERWGSIQQMDLVGRHAQQRM